MSKYVADDCWAEKRVDGRWAVYYVVPEGGGWTREYVTETFPTWEAVCEAEEAVARGWRKPFEAQKEAAQ